MKSEPLLVYTLDRDGPYRAVGLILLGLCVLCSVLLWFWFMAVREEGISGAYSVAWAVGTLLVGWGPLVAWGLGMRHYVRQVRWDAAAGQVELTLLGPRGGRTVRVLPGEFVDVARREGRLAIPFRVKVHAPYHRIRTKGPLGTLVLDGQATVHDAQALEAILDGRAPGT